MDGGRMNIPENIVAIIRDRSGDEAARERCRTSVSWIREIHILNKHDADSGAEGMQTVLQKVAPSSWVLLLESNEWLADDASSLIASTITNNRPGIRAYSFPRFNYWNKRILKGPNYYPDRHIRLMRVADAASSNVEFKESEVMHLENPHVHHALGNTIRDAVMLTEQTDYNAGEPDSSLRDALCRMHTMIAQSGTDVDGDEGLALSYLKAWHTLVNGLIRWEAKGSRESLRDTFALPISTVKREQNEGLMHLLSEREDHLRLIRDLQFELAKRPAHLKDVAALIKQTVSRIFSRKQ